ncbi:MAG: DUF262 domain-containing protein [Planctomycetaceae bacterium]|nr:DUF262 domain-containing protein [Planctomycetaceae bacterium]
MKKQSVLNELIPLPVTGIEEDINEEDISSLPFDPKNIRIVTDQPTISNIIERIKNNEIDLSPKFQRKSGLWKLREKSRLIESLLARIPLPTFYMDAVNEDRWIVIDGLQRLTTLKEYIIDGETSENKNGFRLESLEFLKNCEGKKFCELERRYQRRILETQINVSKIEMADNREVQYTIFRRINTGGLPLSPQEIRHALNQGKITDFLQELAEYKQFAQACWNTLNASRMEDRECILRFLAFFHYGVDSYPGSNSSMDAFLNECMYKLNKEEDKTYNKLRTNFSQALELATELFGRYAFRKPYKKRIYPFNKAIFESLMVALGKLNQEEQLQLQKKKNLLKKEYEILFTKNPDINDSFTSSTGQIGRVKKRFDALEQLISKILKSND